MIVVPSGRSNQFISRNQRKRVEFYNGFFLFGTLDETCSSGYARRQKSHAWLGFLRLMAADAFKLNGTESGHLRGS
jgi:hypothetical protein